MTKPAYTHKSMFSEHKAAQVAACFMNLAGGSLPILKLMKLMYLADREALDKYGEPITYDAMVSMPHGPVLSQVYGYISGACKPDPQGWEGWVSDRENHEVSLKRPFEQSDLDELSEADIQVIADVWAQFGQMDRWEIRDYTHDHCAEWQDPDCSSMPITYRDVFKALGRGDKEAESLQADIMENERINRLFASL